MDEIYQLAQCPSFENRCSLQSLTIHENFIMITFSESERTKLTIKETVQLTEHVFLLSDLSNVSL